MTLDRMRRDRVAVRYIIYWTAGIFVCLLVSMLVNGVEPSNAIPASIAALVLVIFGTIYLRTTTPKARRKDLARARSPVGVSTNQTRSNNAPSTAVAFMSGGLAMQPAIERRAFIQRAAALIPMIHIGALLPFSPAMGRSQTPSTSKPTQSARFARLRLQCAQLNECEHFYRNTLELPTARKSASNLEVTCGSTTIEFIQPPAPADNTQPYYHFAFNIPHNKLDAALQWTQARSEVVPRSDGSLVYHFPRWDAHAFYFLDPAGNILEFIARHTLRNDAPGEFTSRDVLCASEIGVVTPDVSATAARLKRALALDNYIFASEGFAPIGDEHGLFIVVSQGRRWLGSDRTAKIFDAHAQRRTSSDGDDGDEAAPLRLEEPSARFTVMN